MAEVGGERDCEVFLSADRASGVHDLLVEVLGVCSCQCPGRVEQLFGMQVSKDLLEVPSPVPLLRSA